MLIWSSDRPTASQASKAASTDSFGRCKDIVHNVRLATIWADEEGSIAIACSSIYYGVMNLLINCWTLKPWLIYDSWRTEESAQRSRTHKPLWKYPRAQIISTQKRGKDLTKHIQAPENDLVASLACIVCRRALDGAFSIVKYKAKHIDHTASCSTAPLVGHIMSTSTPRDLRRKFVARANNAISLRRSKPGVRATTQISSSRSYIRRRKSPFDLTSITNCWSASM
jgi:hypothetical protein